MFFTTPQSKKQIYHCVRQNLRRAIPQVVPQNLFHFNRDHICFLLVDVVACTIQMFQLTIKDTAKLGKLELIQKNNISISIPQSLLQTDYLGSFPFLTSKTSEPNLWSEKQTAAVSSPLISTLSLSPQLWKTFETVCCPLAPDVLSPYSVCLCLFWYLRLLHCLDLPCRLWRSKVVRRSAMCIITCICGWQTTTFKLLGCQYC